MHPRTSLGFILLEGHVRFFGDVEQFLDIAALRPVLVDTIEEEAADGGGEGFKRSRVDGCPDKAGGTAGEVGVKSFFEGIAREVWVD